MQKQTLTNAPQFQKWQVGRENAISVAVCTASMFCVQAINSEHYVDQPLQQH
uniref:Uncharacterized protein n=1 Tax=Octopus bimaculoides TaxID=37653 RepID=A0A0L8H7P6_OCTBM